MTKLDSYRNNPKTPVTTLPTPRTKLRVLAIAAAKRGELFKPCSWCFGSTPELDGLDNISHSICPTCFQKQTGATR